MFRVCARNYHSYTDLTRSLGIVREPTLWWFITSKYPGTHDIGRAGYKGLQAATWVTRGYKGPHGLQGAKRGGDRTAACPLLSSAGSRKHAPNSDAAPAYPRAE